MQRLFTTFPGGAPGLGLLLLRLAVAAVLVAHGADGLLDRAPTTVVWVVGLLAAVTATLLVLGLGTPLAGAAAAVVAASLLLSLAPPTRNSLAAGATVFAVAMAAAALALIGPGAFSIDAALFGRREISIPRQPRDDRGESVL